MFLLCNRFSHLQRDNPQSPIPSHAFPIHLSHYADSALFSTLPCPCSLFHPGHQVLMCPCIMSAGRAINLIKTCWCWDQTCFSGRRWEGNQSERGAGEKAKNQRRDGNESFEVKREEKLDRTIWRGLQVAIGVKAFKQFLNSWVTHWSSHAHTSHCDSSDLSTPAAAISSQPLSPVRD